MKKVSSVFLLILSLIAVLQLLGTQQTVSAADHCVEPAGAAGCFMTIQTAVDAAADGDTVRVVSGTYDENLVVMKNLTLLGGFDDTTFTNRTPRNSTIDGGGRNSVIRITSGANVTLDGFTVTSGDATSSGGFGGGVYLNGATAIIHDNLIENNVASSSQDLSGAGGGVYIENTTQLVTLTNNTIRNNRAYDAVINDPETAVSLGFGGGVRVWHGSEVVARDNEIVNNIAAQAGEVEITFGAGGGFAANGATTTITLENNTIENNTANHSGGEGSGGGLVFFNVKVIELDSNTIAHNVASVASYFALGGGVYANPQTSLTMTNNIIHDNVTALTGTSGRGGGVYLFASDTGSGQQFTLTGNQVLSNTVLLNTTGSYPFANGGGISIWGQEAENETFTLENNEIRNNATAGTVVVGGEGELGGDFNSGGVNAEYISVIHMNHNDISNNVVVRDYTATGIGNWFGNTSGGGLFFINNTDVQIMDNQFIGNIVTEEQNITDISLSDSAGGLAFGNNSKVVIARNEIAHNLVIKNSTLTSSFGNDHYVIGGGIVVDCWDLPVCDYQIVGNHIHDNAAVENMTLLGNAVGGGGAGGIQVHSNNTEALIRDNVFTNNTGHLHDQGWGAAVSTNGTTVHLSANQFIGNGFSSQADLGSPVIQIDDSVFTSVNDILTGNFMGVTGWTNSMLSFTNDTLIDNGTTAIGVGGNSNATVNNSIIVYHMETGLSQLDETSSITSNYNLLRNPENYQGGVVAGANDLLNIDPLFVNAPSGNLQLRPGSPAVDAGDNSVAPAVDFAGKKRPFDGDFNGTAQVDMGAYELGHTLYLPVINRN